MKRISFLLLFTALMACQDVEKPDDTGIIAADADGDGVPDGEDCDDGNADAYPGAEERCDGIDNNCDGEVDEGTASDATIWYQDGDGDGYGDESVTVTACDAPAAYVATGGDCDDEDAAINPEAEEVCDGSDNDCDGNADEGAADASTWYADGDGDGFGTSGSTTAACDMPSGYVADISGGLEDCDDDNAAIHPNADEVCDGNDNDCDALVDDDDGSLSGAFTWYADDDGDGYGQDGTTSAACLQPSGYVANDSDCDDGDAAINPAAAELCDGIDNDCDGAADDGVIYTTWYLDTDLDGYGDPTLSTSACAQPSGYVAAGGDCDDDDAAINPGATEVCDGIDNDCDGTSDDGLLYTSWYADADGDTFGDATVTSSACAQPTGFVADTADCDDGDAAINPAATEICDGLDNDCDGKTDDADSDIPPDVSTWYLDADGDGYGLAGSTSQACVQPTGYAALSGDCDDTNNLSYPAATEICDGVDNDCDSAIDEDLTYSTWYADSDGDGYGDPGTTTSACAQPTGFVGSSSDCDDTDAAVHPGASESCNGVDDDCDGSVDDGLTYSTWYADADGDGYGDATVSSSGCTQPSGTTATGGDCDDTDAAVHPGASESCNGVDDDCDSNIDEGLLSTWYTDADGDGYGDSSSSTSACSQPSGTASSPTDCDDTNSGINPGATEVCDDGVDNDCDGGTDEGCTATTIVEHCGTISSDETWSASDTHLLTCNVYVQGGSRPTLTVADGTVVQLENAVSIYVGTSNYGTLQVNGTSSGVLFTSADASPSPGDWDRIQFGAYDNGSELIGATVEYGGYGGYGNIYLYNASPTITRSVIQHGADAGISATGSSQPVISDTWIMDNQGTGYDAPSGGLDISSGASFIDNVVTGNDGFAVTVLAEYAEAIDGSCTFTGNDDDRVELTADTLDGDATWQALDVPYFITGAVYVQGSAHPELTIEDGAEIQFDHGTSMYVGTSNYGGLYVQGTSAGVLMTSGDSSPAAGDWDRVQLGAYDLDSELTGLTMEYGGSGGYGNLYLYSADPSLVDCILIDSASHGLYGNGAFPAISGSLFADNNDDGLYLNTSSGLSRSGSPSFDGNEMVDNGGFAMTVPADYLGEIGSSNTVYGNGEDFIQVLADTVTDDATWRAQDVPFMVAGHIYVQDSSRPEVTAEDGVVMAFDHGIAMYVGTSNYGGFHTDGSTLGVVMTAYDASPRPGDWNALQYGGYTIASTLKGLTVEYGGGSGYGGVYLYSGTVDMEDCTLQYNDNAGVYVTGGTLGLSDSLVYANQGYGIQVGTSGALSRSGSPSFSGNVLTGNDTYPIWLPSNYLGELDNSSSFSGNGDDGILVSADTVQADATWQAQDVDYVFEGHTYIQDSTRPHVDIESGAVLRFEGGISFYVGTSNYGSLSVSGTSTAGVLFSSAETASPAAGDWKGVQLGGYCVDASTGLQYLTVEYGGGNGYGNLYFYGCNGSVSHATSQYSSKWGIYRSSGSTPTLTDISYVGNASGDLY